MTAIPIRPRIAAKTVARNEADFTEAGDAERFIELHRGRVRYVPAWSQWIIWNGSRWVRDSGEVHVSELAKDVGRAWFNDAASHVSTRNEMLSRGKAALSARGIRALLTLARGIDGVTLDHERLDTNGWLFGVANGVVDLRTGKRRPADPDDLMTMQSSVAYDPAATCPRWMRALEQWFPDPEVRDYVQRLVGVALIGAQCEHVFVIHYGGGRNGKGCFVRALALPFGPYFIAPHLSLIVQQKHHEHDTVKADLFRRRLAVASETERRVRLAEAQVKNLTGGDRIRCRRMREDPWEFSPTHSLWLLTNFLPEISGRDAAMWARMKVVPWTENFEGRGDPSLDDALTAEAPGILAWAVRGCLEYQKRGLSEPEAVVRATLEYRATEDLFSRFAKDCGLRFDAQHRHDAKMLSALLDDWAVSEGVTPSRSDFNDWLTARGATKVRGPKPHDGPRPWIWRGVGVEP